MKVQFLDRQNKRQWLDMYPVIPRQNDCIADDGRIYEIERVVLRSCSKTFTALDEQPKLTGVVAYAFCKCIREKLSK